MELQLGPRNPRTGLTPLAGTLDDEAVEIFRQATDPLAAPDPADNGVKDPRSPGEPARPSARRPRSAGTSTPATDPPSAGTSRTSR